MADSPRGDYVPYPWIRDELEEAKGERKEIRDLVSKLSATVDTLVATRAVREASRARITRILIATIGAAAIVAAAIAAN